MAIHGPGSPIDLQEIATEFGDSAPHSVNEFYRGGGIVPDSATNVLVPTSGAISLGNFYGAANIVALALTITSNTNNYDLYTVVSSNPGYVAGATAVTLTVNPGVTVSSTSTGTYALQVPSAFSPSDQINIVNNGTIVGAGGNGGSSGYIASSGGPPGNGIPGSSGGNALYINRPVTITNNGTLAGAGGGGGGGGSASLGISLSPKSGIVHGVISGNGGGGGAGVNAGAGALAGPVNPGYGTQYMGNSGANGTATTGGAGGARRYSAPGTHPTAYYTGTGGTGGARGAAGSAAEGSVTVPGQAAAGSPGSGGASGRYITGNSFATWATTGTRLGGSS